jgi:hypothetical protein
VNAPELLAEADAAMLRRKICLTAYVALTNSPSPAVAIKAIRGAQLAPEIRDGAIRLIEALAARR